MADGTISSKLQLDGEQQYKKALNDAYRSLRVLRSELKAETAELGRNASEQDKARAKMQSLQKQIQQQEKIVKTLEKALADSKKEYADNAEVQDKWEEKLNKARAALADMQNALGDCEEGLSKFNDSMQEAANSSGEAMQTVVSFNDAMKSIGNIASGIGNALSGIFTNTVDTMKSMVEEMFNLMSMAWSAAGEWDQIQTIWGGDLASIEKVYTAMALQGIDASQVTSGIQKFITNVHNGNEDTLAALEQLHMSEDQFSNHWDFFVAVMDKASMFKDKEGYNLMTALFGDKKGAGMTDMLKNWREAMNRYEKDIEQTGIELSSPELEQLNKVSHQITEIQELWNSIKTNIGAKLSDVLNMDQLSEDTLEILRDIGSILNSDGENRAEIVLKLSDDIEKLIGDITSGMENLSGFLKELGGDLQKSDNPLVRFIGQLISGLSGILDWLSVHGSEITGFLEQALPWILQNKILEATTGEGIAGHIKNLFDIGLDILTVTTLGKALGAGAAAELTTAATGIGSVIGAAILKAVPGLAFLATLLNPSATSDKTGNNEIFDENGNLTNEAKEYGYSLDTNGNLVQGPVPDQYTNGSTGPTIDLTADHLREIQDWTLGDDATLDEIMSFVQENSKSVDSMTESVDDALRDSGLLNNDMFKNISAALQNLSNDKYKGETDADLPGKIGSAVASAVKGQPITVNVYVDGERMTDGVNTRLGSMLAAGVFG